ncbi:hypothetical protein BDP55DRAFT_654661 [Colletotrichum godetiae]|uniref:Secreted protein n=1 Tax=Colletotrichum godetiae TaxID=1209918 RepID=A0AAJ0ARW1_9PEZI|nr:uncharacterized protein BDP55DRAFT_654661 [Colletotrichum godetiae]KAK1689235.1 hypothetical protein BDP55DRAFT_654661 [Colletotrichum godetiae]
MLVSLSLLVALDGPVQASASRALLLFQMQFVLPPVVPPNIDRLTLYSVLGPACGLPTTSSSQAKARASGTCVHGRNFWTKSLRPCGPPGRIAGCFSFSRATAEMSRANCETQRLRGEKKITESKTDEGCKSAKPVAKWNIRTCRTPIWRGELVLLRQRTRSPVRCFYLIEESAK